MGLEDITSQHLFQILPTNLNTSSLFVTKQELYRQNYTTLIILLEIKICIQHIARKDTDFKKGKMWGKHKQLSCWNQNSGMINVKKLFSWLSLKLVYRPCLPTRRAAAANEVHNRRNHGHIELLNHRQYISVDRSPYGFSWFNVISISI